MFLNIRIQITVLLLSSWSSKPLLLLLVQPKDPLRALIDPITEHIINRSKTTTTAVGDLCLYVWAEEGWEETLL